MEVQLPLGTINDDILEEKITEAKNVIRMVVERSDKPLILQFSGGNDSMTMLDIVRDCGITNYTAAYMATGTELPGVVNFVRDFCKQNGIPVLISHPGMHKGNLFHRIEQFRSFPNLGTFDGGGKRLWCCRDLKLRPQKKLLVKEFGKGTFYRLEGVRRFESNRRKIIYRPYAETFMRPDDEFKGSFEVYPILNWSNDDVKNYIKKKNLPVLTLYKDFGVSGCSWCPFYDADIYASVLRKFPDWSVYSRIIEWETKLDTPSIVGGLFLRDVKDRVLSGDTRPFEKVVSRRRPCMMEYQGKMVKTCDLYGHLYIDGKCFRCDEPEVKNE